MSAVLDTLFGTRAHTPGAALQLPRKVPLRIEPKTWFGKLSSIPSSTLTRMPKFTFLVLSKVIL